uniref:RING-type domain-containing protein n=1 Tax=Kalanchoe fedtschenkoi TaxID=63787 RepID=A0A7N0VMU9_KALFE
MVSDSIPLAYPSHAKDFNKKKRANRSAKLKQCKLDARREQWLSQVKRKGAKEDVEERCETVGKDRNDKGLPAEAKLEVKPRGDEKGCEDGQEGGHSDLESSPLNSPGSNIFGTTFAVSSSVSSSSVTSGGTCSGNVTEDDEEEGGERADESDGCVDDWEAIADALSDNDKKHAPNSDPPNEPKFATSPMSSCGGFEKGSAEGELPKPLPLRVSKFNRGTRAWRPDDAFRPRGLPNFSKQRSLPVKSGRQLGRGARGFLSFNSSTSVASACDCPICYEELDVTDASFFPCPCGFRMCLFCYKRICEDDGRCPGCRKHYKSKESSKSETSSEGGGY